MRLFFYKHRQKFNRNTDCGNFFRKHDSTDPKSLSVYDMSYAYGKNFSYNTEKPFRKKCAYDVNDMSLCKEAETEGNARHYGVRVRGSDKTELPLMQQLLLIKPPLRNQILNHLFYSFFIPFKSQNQRPLPPIIFSNTGGTRVNAEKASFNVAAKIKKPTVVLATCPSDGMFIFNSLSFFYKMSLTDSFYFVNLFCKKYDKFNI